MRLKAIWTLIIVICAIFACDTNKLKETPIDDFIGIWEIKGRQIFEGVKINISKNEHGKLVGNVLSINENKYVQLFVEPGDIWITDISRSSNYQFTLTEKKIASALFGLYGISTSVDYNVEFIDKNTFGLGTEESDPTKSDVRYIRVE